MRIGIDAKRAFFNYRGLGNYGRNLISGLNKYHSQSQLYLYTPTLKSSMRGDFPSLFNNKNIIIEPQKFWSKLPALWRRKKITSLIVKENLDVYHGISHELPLGIEKFNGKKIVTIHDLQYLKQPQFFSMIDRNVYDRKVKHACNVADKIITICNHTKNDLLEYLPQHNHKVVTHYQSCSEVFYPEFHLPTDSVIHSKPFILNVGAFVPNKNQLLLISAFKEISKIFPHDLFLIGSGKNKAYYDDILSLIEELDLKDRVIIKHDVNQIGLVDYYRQADLFCFPSLYEGFGIPLLEAMFCCTPVLCSNTSSLPEVGGHAVDYFDPNDENELCTKMKAILENENKIQKMKSAGLEQAQKFHLEMTTKNLLEIYLS